MGKERCRDRGRRINGKEGDRDRGRRVNGEGERQR